MTKKNRHIGSTFESWLDEAGIREEVTIAAIKAVIARQLADEMKKKKLTKKRMVELMKTSRAQLDRLLDPDNGKATIESLQRAAKIVGRELRMELVRSFDGRFFGAQDRPRSGGKRLFCRKMNPPGTPAA
jgi:antitoxin HicB